MKELTINNELLRRDRIDFMLNDWLRLDELLKRPDFNEHSADTVARVLDLSAELAGRYFAPHNRASDLNEPFIREGKVIVLPAVREALEAYASSGLLRAASMTDEHQLPHLVHRASFMWFQAANIATASYAMLTIAQARLLVNHADKQLLDTYLPQIAEGRCFGTMCLSEPEVGSSLADISTTAAPGIDGVFRLRGQKMWISGGDHEMSENILHLVLARTGEQSTGVRGLSLFLVPKLLVDAETGHSTRNDVSLVGLNHKMGYRGTVNAALTLGDGSYRPHGSPGAVGYLVGELGAGLAYMFQMMNEARIGVGAGAAALGSAGYLHALNYAKNRRQGRDISLKDPSRPPVPIVRHPDVRRMLIASKAYAEGSIALVLHAARLLDDSTTLESVEARARAALLLDVLTPIVKSWPSQWCLQANDFAIQVLGGSGYTRDEPVEQYYRDNRLNPIHEGTFGIQALDLLGRKVRLAGGEGFSILLEEIRTTAALADGDLDALGRSLEYYADLLEEATRASLAIEDRARSLANAGPYLEAAGHVVVAWHWLSQTIVARQAGARLRDELAQVARYFFTHELPRCEPLLSLVRCGDDSMLTLDESLL